MARVGLARLEYLLERVNRALDLEGSDVTVNTLTTDLGVTVTAGGLLELPLVIFPSPLGTLKFSLAELCY